MLCWANSANPHQWPERTLARPHDRESSGIWASTCSSQYIVCRPEGVSGECVSANGASSGRLYDTARQGT